MRLTSLAFFSSLIVAAAGAHLSGNDASSSSSALLLTREVVFPSAPVAGLNLERRAEEYVEEVDVEIDDDDASSEGPLETRGRKHKKAKAHHRSAKHSGRRSGHKKKQQQHHKQPPAPKRPTHVKTAATSGGKFNGKGTFFRPDQGACGAWNTVNDKIVALSADIYQGGKHCFSSVRICHGSKCANAKVADLCPGCHHTSLDMSPSLFKELANPDVGVIDIQWSFM